MEAEPTKAQQWQRISDLFHSALEREPEERAAFLAQGCAGDESLRLEVKALLEGHERADSFFGTPALEVAAGLFAQQTIPSLEGSMLGHYQVLSLIGTGGMGHIFLADDTRLKRKVAIKVLPAAFTVDPDRIRRFEQEALAASSLNHPNIITIHEVGQVEDAPFIITEFIEGETLRRQMVAHKIRLREAIDVALQVASALEAAHKAGIVHRDIKPENIMLRPDGVVKVLDFGLAKLTEAQSSTPDAKAKVPAGFQTKTGLVMGTVTYMSPEQARGLPVDARSDLFSLGTVIYEMVSSHVPFEGATNSDVIVSILERDPAPLSRDNSGVPAELERIVRRALARNLEERYQLAGDLLTDLKNLKQEMELQARLDAVNPSGLTPAAGLPISADNDEQAKTRSADTEVSRTKTRKRALAVGLAALLIAAAAIMYSTYFTRGEAIDSIAVLPFVNVGNDPNAEYLSDGISDSIINSLSELPNLKKVISFSSVMRYKGKPIERQAVGRELNVGALLTGRLTLRGEEVLVSTELVDVKNDKRLWGGQYSYKLADVSRFQSEIAQDVSDKLRLRLTSEQQERLAKPNTENAEAFRLYLQGRYFLSKNTDEATLKSGKYFERAIEKDPNFALAYAELALYYNIMANFGNMRPNEARPKAEEAAVRALAIDDRLSQAHQALAIVKMFYDWDWPGAEREFKRAIELEPELVQRGNPYVRLLELLGRFDEAIAEVNKAGEMPPGWRGPRLPDILYSARRYDEAIAGYRKQLEKEPNRRGVLQMQIGMAYVEQGKYEEALAAVREARPVVTQPRHLAQIGYVYAAAGKRDEAVRILEELKALTGERHNLSTHIAAIDAAIGNRDEALAWLKRACDEHEQGVVDLKIDQRFDTLRSDPRFMDLLRRVKLAP